MPSHALLLLVAARMKEFFREPGAVFWTFGFPLITALALGIAFRTQGVPRTEVALVEGPAAIDLERVLAADARLAVRVMSLSEAQTLLHRARVALVISAPAEGGAPIEYLFDPTRPDSVVVRQTVNELLQRSAGRTDVRATRDDLIQAPGERYIDWLVPGLLGMQLMQGALWGLGWNVVTARERKLLKRLLATPMPRSYYLLSLVLSALLFVPLQAGVLFLFARLVFGVTIQGSWVGLLFLSALGTASFAGIGLLCAARARNTETINGLINLVALPMFVLSGVFFTSTRFPSFVQPVIQALPLTALNDALRHVVNDGASIFAHPLPMVILAGWGLVSFALALRIFRWT